MPTSTSRSVCESLGGTLAAGTEGLWTCYGWRTGDATPVGQDLDRLWYACVADKAPGSAGFQTSLVSQDPQWSSYDSTCFYHDARRAGGRDGETRADTPVLFRHLRDDTNRCTLEACSSPASP